MAIKFVCYLSSSHGSFAHLVLSGTLSSQPTHNSPSASQISENPVMNAKIVPSFMNLQSSRKERHQTCNYQESVQKKRMEVYRGLEKAQLGEPIQTGRLPQESQSQSIPWRLKRKLFASPGFQHWNKSKVACRTNLG